MKAIETTVAWRQGMLATLEVGPPTQALEWRTERRHPRLACEHPVKTRLIAAEPVEEFGTTTAIGLGGCAIQCSRRLGYRSLVELQIPLIGGVVSADGRVAYELERGPASFEIGIEFLRLPASHRERIRALFG